MHKGICLLIHVLTKAIWEASGLKFGHWKPIWVITYVIPFISFFISLCNGVDVLYLNFFFFIDSLTLKVNWYFFSHLTCQYATELNQFDILTLSERAYLTAFLTQ